MSIFSSYDLPYNPGQQIVQVASLLLDRASELHLRDRGRRWSTAELRLDDRDFEWLLDWTAKLPPSVVRQWLQPGQTIELLHGDRCQRPSALGLALLTLFAEQARRFAREKQLWPHVTRALESALLYPLLFVSGNRQPRPELKDSIEAAARAFGLRHVFGVQATQNWFITIYLQFGLTRYGVRERLGGWLAGQYPSKAIHLLTGDQESGASQAVQSADFDALWTQLLKFREGKLSESGLRQALLGSPWILPDWTDDIVAGGKAHIRLGVRHFAAQIDIHGGSTSAAPGDSAAGSVTELSPEAALLHALIGPPQLMWQLGKTPRFQCSIGSSAPVEQDENGLVSLDGETGDGNVSYAVRLAVSAEASLRRQPGGGYEPWLQEPLEFDASAPVIAAQLMAWRVNGDRTVAADIAASLEVTLWDAAEPINLFDDRGRRINEDPWQARLRPDRLYYLLLTGGLRLVSANDNFPWCFIGNDATPAANSDPGPQAGERATLWLLAAGWDPQAVMVVAPDRAKAVEADEDTDGEAAAPINLPVWQPSVAIQDSSTNRACVDQSVTLEGPFTWGGSGAYRPRIEQVAYGSEYWLQASHPTDASVEGAWVNGSPAGKTCFRNDRTIIGPATLAPLSRASNAHVVLVMRFASGQHATVRQRVKLQPLGAAMIDPQRGWRRLGEGETITVADSEACDVLLLPPNEWQPGSHCALIEGETWAGSAISGHPLGHLGGFGGRLTMVSRVFNSFDEPMMIASEVCDPGIVTGLKLESVRTDTETAADCGEATEFTTWIATLQLRQVLEPDENYRAVVLYRSGRHAIMPIARVAQLGDGVENSSSSAEWQVECIAQRAGEQIAAIGISYRGERLGCGWTEHWSDGLDSVGMQSAGSAAALLRWLKLPLLAKPHCTNVASLVEAYLPRVIAAWLCEAFLPKGLAYTETANAADAWLSAVADLCLAYPQPEKAQVLGIWRCYDNSLVLMAESLLRVDPFYMARIVQLVLNATVNANPATDTRLGELICELAGVICEADVKNAVSRLHDDSCCELSCDSKFLDNLLQQAVRSARGEHLLDVHRRNLGVMPRSVAPLRRLIAITLLQQPAPGVLVGTAHY